jgi:hypothetical protein
MRQCHLPAAVVAGRRRAGRLGRGGHRAQRADRGKAAVRRQAAWTGANLTESRSRRRSGHGSNDATPRRLTRSAMSSSSCPTSRPRCRTPRPSCSISRPPWWTHCRSTGPAVGQDLRAPEPKTAANALAARAARCGLRIPRRQSENSSRVDDADRVHAVNYVVWDESAACCLLGGVSDQELRTSGAASMPSRTAASSPTPSPTSATRASSSSR